MLKIRLQRVGRKNDASFRVVVTESQRGPKAGDNIEVLGFHDPRRNSSEVNKERVEYWMSVGAQVSDTVHNLLVEKGIVKGKKINVLPKKSPIKKEKEETAEAPASTSAKEDPTTDDSKAPVEEESIQEAPAENSSKDDTPEAPEEKKEEVVAEKAPQEEETK